MTTSKLRPVLAMVLFLGLAENAARADFDSFLRQLPVAESPADSYIYVVYRFSPSGRYFANHQKYESMSTISRTSAAQQLAAWEAEGKYAVGFIAYRGEERTEADILNEIKLRYRKMFGREMETREQSASIKGVWKGTELGGDVTFELLDGNRARASDKYGKWEGTWQDRGNDVIEVVLSAPHRIVYTMRVRDGEIQGTGFNPSKNETWNVQLSRKPAGQAGAVSAAPQARPAPRPTSLVGTSWHGVHQSTGDRFTLTLGANNRATFQYGGRSIPLNWSESGGTFSIEDITGGRQTASINASSMTTSLNGYAHWTLTRQ